MEFRDKKKILAFFLVGLIGAMLVYGQLQNKPTLVVIDMKRALHQPAFQLSRTQLSPNKQAEMLKQYSNSLPEVISAYGKSHNVTVIAAPVIVSHIEDITDVIIGQTFERLKHHD
ncbi:TrbI F-type domain-containing protein [Legionella septentrionalis]|uniref:TrbI F-type domain-containing protein n=1 Tax=Legionella septentrionalis TaxID=2498109 RepID=UPI0013154D83|nr:TrbI F-type domain-containing protein [Legionella septentrionalis]